MFRMKICVMLLVSFVTAFDLKFDYRISEGKARFVENVETNLGKNIVKIHTPKHNDVLESYLMQDFQKGKQIRCLPFLRQCRLRDIDRKTSSDAGKVTESFVHSWNEGTNSITSTNATVIKEMYYIDGEEVVSTVSLGEDLRTFYEGFEYPLYIEKNIPNDAVVLNITRSSGRRFKRTITPLSSCDNGEAPKIVYGMDTGRSCNYLKICGDIVRNVNDRMVLSNCGNLHITSPLAYMCLCCPGVTVINPSGPQCQCSKMGQASH
ncbi:uncharacterized protein LOC127728803 [Mytilus californianus]|uniref:uncharacterized protein LOC127728803 n=1 Tax=Mytilus californianus TaxID=6549 RepID=UPI002246743B|nr:uncharacterized protein LOC127728803 [Mytilus californianus]